MEEIIWLIDAQNDLIEIYNYISKDSLYYAKKTVYEIIKKVSIKEVRRVINKYHPDIIHAHDFTASVISAMCKKNIKLIEHLHNNCPWLKKFGLKSIAFLYVKTD